MRIDLADLQWDEVNNGELTGPDAVRYHRRTTRTRRRDCDELIKVGTPLVLFYWAGGELAWLDGEDAVNGWKTARAKVTARPARPTKDFEWTAGLWEDLDGHQILVLTGHC